MELATGRIVSIAINHDPDAILMHKTNHPHTKHIQASVWDVDPVKECGGKPVGLAWFSPDCKHFSKAKGGKPVDKNIRGLSWIILRWGMTVAPRVIIMENVEEIQTWGPLITAEDGKQYPDPERKGETFRAFIGMLTDGIAPDHPGFAEGCKFLGIALGSPEAETLSKGLGYKVEWRELVAADYGAHTTRKRFVLVARCDGRPIVWPEPTHDKNGANGLPKWRAAAEIIDWTLPCPSIFATREEIKKTYGLTAQRPLRPNTMRRVARGVDKFVIKSADPFLVVVNHAGEFRGQEMDSLLQTITAKHGYGVTAPVMIQYHTEQTERVRGQTVTDPIMTIDASNRYGIAAATLTKYYGSDKHGQGASKPLHTITAKDREGVTMASLAKFYGGVVGAAVSEPLPTVTAVDHNALQTAHMVKLKGDNLGGPAVEPVQTITAGGGHHGLVVRVEKAALGVNLQRWLLIRAALNEYCGYNLADDDVILFKIGGAWYFMADVGLRMLTPRELYNAMGFPPHHRPGLQRERLRQE